MEPGITVVLPVRNGAAFIEKAIDSVLAQTVRDLRLVVSDNGSTDDTLARVARYDDPRVSLVRQTESLDMLAHFNKCLDLVATKYYMLLCHDDFLYDPTALAKAHALVEADEQVSAVYCDLAYVDQSARTILIRRFHREGRIAGDEVGRQSILAMRNLFGIPLLVRTRALGSLRYDSRFAYSADIDLSLGISEHGLLYHIPEPLIANRFHGNNATLRLFHTALGQVKGIADKHGIALGRLEQLRMYVASWFTALQKWLFFEYLEHFRR